VPGALAIDVDTNPRHVTVDCTMTMATVARCAPLRNRVQLGDVAMTSMAAT